MEERSRSNYPVMQEMFLGEDDISFYLLGAYMTDGNVVTKKRHKNFNITSSDLDWLEDIRNVICPGKAIYKKQYNCYQFQCSDEAVMEWLMSYGCVPAKSKSLKLTKEIPQIYHRDFIRGAMDGDGSISSSDYVKRKGGKEYHYKKISCYICGASKDFLDEIKRMIPPSINSYIYVERDKVSRIRGVEVKSTCDFYKLKFNDSNAKKLLEWLYYDGHRLSLNRKKKKAEDILLTPFELL